MEEEEEEGVKEFRRQSEKEGEREGAEMRAREKMCDGRKRERSNRSVVSRRTDAGSDAVSGRVPFERQAYQRGGDTIRGEACTVCVCV